MQDDAETLHTSAVHCIKQSIVKNVFVKFQEIAQFYQTWSPHIMTFNSTPSVVTPFLQFMSIKLLITQCLPIDFSLFTEG